jgi:hypothetical protein
MKRRALSIALALVLVAVPASAQAEPQAQDAAAAQALFYKGRALMQQGRYAEACQRFEESLRLDVGIGTQFNLADCNEHIGKTATAWAGFLEVANAAKAAHQAERESVARKRARALEPRLPKLVVEVGSLPAGVTVARDGVAIPKASFGVEVPVDPGVHVITANAPGRERWETSVHTIEARTVRVAVPRDLPGPIAAPAIPATPPPPPVASGATTTVTSAPAENNEGSFPAPVVDQSMPVQRIAGWALAGAGVIAAGVGVGFGLASLGDRNTSRDHCSGDLCDADGVRLRDDAISHGNVATISLIAGGAAIAGGLVLVFTAPRNAEVPARAARLRAVPNVAREGGGFMLEGVFQ